MSDTTPAMPPAHDPAATAALQPSPGSTPVLAAPAGTPPVMNQYANVQVAQPGYAAAPIGKIRSTGVCILLACITFGIYTWVWFYKTHSEMKRHSGSGLDGGLALVLAIVVGLVMPYLTASEIGGLYERRGQAKPVSGVTGLWYFPGAFILIGPLVWFIKTNGALNGYWRSLGAA